LQALQGEHTADGMVGLYYSGKDYYEVFPTWNWQQLPGTLIEQVHLLV